MIIYSIYYQIKDDKTSFIIVELCAALFDFIDNSEDILESDQSHQFCDTINRHLFCENPPELTSVKSCAEICPSSTMIALTMSNFMKKKRI